VSAWLQLLLWLIANMPSLISSIREILDIFRGDAKAAKECLAGLDGACRIKIKREGLGVLRDIVKKRRESAK
jgi:hypothetical protein